MSAFKRWLPYLLMVPAVGWFLAIIGTLVATARPEAVTWLAMLVSLVMFGIGLGKAIEHHDRTGFWIPEPKPPEKPRAQLTGTVYYPRCGATPSWFRLLLPLGLGIILGWLL
jgi:hypothetical protein